MRAFRYRLAAVLSRAQHTERVLQIELARQQDELDSLDQQLGSVQVLQGELHRRIRESLAAAQGRAENVDLAQLLSLQQAVDEAETLAEHIAWLQQQTAEQIAHTRQRLLEAARSRQVLDNHRRDLAERHRRAELAAETKQLDELATSGSARGDPPVEPPGSEEAFSET